MLKISAHELAATIVAAAKTTGDNASSNICINSPKTNTLTSNAVYYKNKERYGLKRRAPPQHEFLIKQKN